MSQDEKEEWRLIFNSRSQRDNVIYFNRASFHIPSITQRFTDVQHLDDTGREVFPRDCQGEELAEFKKNKMIIRERTSMKPVWRDLCMKERSEEAKKKMEEFREWGEGSRARGHPWEALKASDGIPSLRYFNVEDDASTVTALSEVRKQPTTFEADDAKNAEGTLLTELQYIQMKRPNYICITMWQRLIHKRVFWKQLWGK